MKTNLFKLNILGILVLWCLVSIQPVSSEPTNYSWRYSPYKSAIRNQGGCGSCWAVCAAAAVDDTFCIQSAGELCPTASAQYSVMCDQSYFGGVTNNGCYGGHPAAYGVHIVNYGVVTEDCLAYTAKSGDCPTYCNDGTTKVADAHRLWATSWQRVLAADATKTVYEKGTLAIQFRAYNDFYSLNKYDPDEIYMDPADDAKFVFGHALLITGYGVYNGVEYYEVANSWGTSYHDGGYARIRRGTCSSESYMVLYNVDLEREGVDSQLPSIELSDSTAARGSSITITWTNLSATRIQIALVLDGSDKYTLCTANDGSQSIQLGSTLVAGSYGVEVRSFSNTSCTGEMNRSVTDKLQILPPSLASYVSLGASEVDSGSTISTTVKIDGALSSETNTCSLKLLQDGTLITVLQTVTVTGTSTTVTPTIPYTTATGEYTLRCDLGTSSAISVSNVGSSVLNVNGPSGIENAMTVLQPSAGSSFEHGETLVSEVMINDSDAVPYLTINIDLLDASSKEVISNISRFRSASSVTKIARVSWTISSDIPDGEYLVRFQSSYSAAVFKYSPSFTVGEPDTTTPNEIYLTTPSSGTSFDGCSDTSVVIAGMFESSSYSAVSITINIEASSLGISASYTTTSKTDGTFSITADLSADFCVSEAVDYITSTITATVPSLNLTSDSVSVKIIPAPIEADPLSLRSFEITSGVTNSNLTLGDSISISIGLDGTGSGVSGSVSFDFGCPAETVDGVYYAAYNSTLGTISVGSTSSVVLSGSSALKVDATKLGTKCTVTANLECDAECGSNTSLTSPSFSTSLPEGAVTFIKPTSGTHAHEYYSVVDVDITAVLALKSFAVQLVHDSTGKAFDVMTVKSNSGTHGIDYTISSDLPEGDYHLEVQSTDPLSSGFSYKYTDATISVVPVALQDVVEFTNVPTSANVQDDYITVEFSIVSEHASVDFPIELSLWLNIENNTYLVQKCSASSTTVCTVSPFTIVSVIPSGTVSTSTKSFYFSLTSSSIAGSVLSTSVVAEHPVEEEEEEDDTGGELPSVPYVVFPDVSYTVSRGISFTVYLGNASKLADKFTVKLIKISDGKVQSTSTIENTGTFEIGLSYFFTGEFKVVISDSNYEIETPVLIAGTGYLSGFFINIAEDGSSVFAAGNHLFEWRLHDHSRSPNVKITLEDVSTGEKTVIAECASNDDSENITLPSSLTGKSARIILTSRTSTCGTMYIPDTISPTFYVGHSSTDPNEPDTESPVLEVSLSDDLRQYYYSETIPLVFSLFVGGGDEELTEEEIATLAPLTATFRESVTKVQVSTITLVEEVERLDNSTIVFGAEVTLSAVSLIGFSGTLTLEISSNTLGISDIVDVVSIGQLLSVGTVPSSVAYGNLMSVPITLNYPSSMTDFPSLTVYVEDSNSATYCARTLFAASSFSTDVLSVDFECDTNDMKLLGTHRFVVFDNSAYQSVFSESLNIYEVASSSFKFHSPVSQTLYYEDVVDVSFGFTSSSVESGLTFTDALDSLTISLTYCDIENPVVVRELNTFLFNSTTPDGSYFDDEMRTFVSKFGFDAHDSAGCYRLRASMVLIQSKSEYEIYSSMLTYDTSLDVYTISTPTTVTVGEEFEIEVVILSSSYGTEPFRLELIDASSDSRISIIEDSYIPSSFTPTIKFTVEDGLISSSSLPKNVKVRVYALIEPIDTIAEHTFKVESAESKIISITSQTITSGIWGQRFWIYFSVTDSSIASMAVWLLDAQSGKFVYNLLGNTKPSYKETELTLPASSLGFSDGFYVVRLFSTTGTSAEDQSQPIYISKTSTSSFSTTLVVGGTLTVAASALLGIMYSKRIARRARTGA